MPLGGRKRGVLTEAAALAELEAAEDLRARWEAAAAAKQAELDQLERRTGEDVLAAADADREVVAAALSEQAARLRSAIDVDKRTARAAAERLPAARRAVTLAKAAELRTRAEVLLAQASRLQVRTDELLGLLRDHEGCDFMPWRLDHEAFEQALREGGSAPAPHVPASERLRREAAGLQREADRLEESVRIVRAVPSVTLTLDEVLDPSKPWQTVNDRPLVRAVAGAHVTDGEGGPHVFQVLIDGEGRETVTLAAGLAERLIVGLGVPPLEKPVEVVATIDGRPAVRIVVDTDGSVLPFAVASAVPLDGAELPADDPAAVVAAAFADED